MAAAASIGRDKAQGQVSLFDALTTAPARSRPKKGAAVTPWSPEEKLAAEKELLGFYVTGHPLDRYRSLFDTGKYVAIANLAAHDDPTERNPVVTVAGSLVSVDKRFSKKSGKPFALVILEDLTDSIEVGVFGEAFAKSAAHIEAGKLVSITARLDARDEGVIRLTANEISPLKKPAASTKPVHLNLHWDGTSEQDLFEIRDALLSSSGMRPVIMNFEREDGARVRVIPAQQFSVDWTPALEQRLGRWIRS